MKKLVPLAISVFSIMALHAQNPSFSRDVIASGGDYFVSPVGSLSWTLGETVIETFENSSINFVLTQGFQQPDEKDNAIGIRELPDNEVVMRLYPNPTVASISMDFSYDENSSIRIVLVDMLGRILNTDEIDVTKGHISNYRFDVSGLSPGMYMFQFTDRGQLLSSCKFQKLSD